MTILRSYGIPHESVRYPDWKEAAQWAKKQLEIGNKLYYYPVQSNRVRQVHLVVMSQNDFFAVDEKHESYCTLMGCKMIAMSKEDNHVVGQWQWFNPKIVNGKTVSKHVVESKKEWLVARLKRGRLLCCYPQASTPFVITNIAEDEQGIYALNMDSSMKVYLNKLILYSINPLDGHLEIHGNR